MNTDKSIISDYLPGLPPNVERRVREWLSDCPSEAVKSFLEDLTHEVAMLRSHAHGRAETPDGQDQRRYLDKIAKQSEKAGQVLVKLNELLETSPMEFRSAARSAGADVQVVQAQLTTLLLTLNDLTPRKARVHPEIAYALKGFAASFERRFGVKPVFRSINQIWEIEKNDPLPERFVPIASILLNLSVDQVSRVARKNLLS